MTKKCTIGNKMEITILELDSKEIEELRKLLKKPIPDLLKDVADCRVAYGK